MSCVHNEDRIVPRSIEINIIVLDEPVLDQLLWQCLFHAVPVVWVLPGLISQKEKRLAKITCCLVIELPDRSKLNSTLPVLKIQLFGNNKTRCPN
jgi:hypothetical protein